MYNYSTNLEKNQVKTLLNGFLFFCLIFTLFFPIRHVFITPQAYLTGEYSDLTSFSLYLNDILIILLFFVNFRDFLAYLKEKRPRFGIAVLVFWLICGLFFHFNQNFSIHLYWLIRVLILIVAYETIVVILRKTSLKSLFLSGFVGFSVIQAVIALVQFAKQSPIGLFKVGESHIGPNILGVAKVVVEGSTFIRGYGTFPHPNPFSAFLIVGALTALYLLISAKAKKSKIAYILALFIIILGLTVTFSRGAYLALGFGLIIFFCLQFLAYLKEKHTSDNLKTAIFSALMSISLSIAIFYPFLATRATFSDQSTKDRKFYNNVGILMVKGNLILGLGMGESVLHMEQYSQTSLKPWEKQPPHNFFIIAAAELGIPGVLVLIWILLSHLWGLIKKIKSSTNFKITPYSLLLTSILASFLLLMQFDHYFYTINQTQLLLWIILGMAAAETRPQSAPPQA